MDRSVLKISRIGVTINNERHLMRRHSTSAINFKKSRDSNKILVFLLVIIIQSTIVECLVCYDGADCLQTHTCNECNGVGCIRMKSYNTEHIHSIALTCLPYATRTYQLEPAGCRISLTGDSEHCICYDIDYCNRATGAK
ncbi:hypothetical protein DINM_022575 [Dirofilaria immitis]|nr:hypothetical protein [Dirofilaria immitis]